MILEKEKVNEDSENTKNEKTELQLLIENDRNLKLTNAVVLKAEEQRIEKVSR
ncbi:hypothetical protein ACFL1F_00965 [Chlamydiota bacterium]